MKNTSTIIMIIVLAFLVTSCWRELSRPGTGAIDRAFWMTPEKGAINHEH